MFPPHADPPRVLAYSDSRVFSGAESFLCTVVADLARRGTVDVLCAAPRENERLFEALRLASGSEPLDAPSQALPVAALGLYSPRRRRAVRRLLAESDPDVVLLNLPSAEYGATPIPVRGEGSPPILGVIHITGSPKELGFSLGALRDVLAKRALRKLDSVGVLSETALESYGRFWSSGRTATHIVRLPAPKVTPVDRAAAREELGLPEGPLVGIAGRISLKQKGHDILAQSDAIMARGRPEIAFAVAGEGRDRSDLEGLLAQLGVTEQFHFLGQVEPIEKFLCALDAVAIPSRFEGLPFVALEAISLGIPGVAASNDGLRDVWPAAWQVPGDDAEAFAARTLQVLDQSPEDRNAGLAEGRERMERCTNDDLGGQVEKLLMGLLDD